MTFSKKAFLCAAVAAITGVQIVSAMPVGITDTKTMCETADVIVAGKTEKVESKIKVSVLGGKCDDTILVAIESTIKNTSGKPLSKQIKIVSRQNSDVSLARGEGHRGIYFLKLEKDAALTPVDEQHISVPFSPLSKCPSEAGRIALDTVADEMAKVISTPAEKLNYVGGKSFGYYEDMFKYKGAYDQAAVEYDLAIDAVRGIPARYAVPYLEKIVHNTNMRCRLRAVEALGQLKNFEQIPILEPLLMNPPQELGYDVGRFAFHMIIEDKKYVPLLKRLTGSKDKRVRYAANESLKFINQK